MKSVSATPTSTSMTTTSTTLPKQLPTPLFPPQPRLPAFPQPNTYIYPTIHPSITISHHFPSSNSSVSATVAPHFAHISGTKNNVTLSAYAHKSGQVGGGIGISKDY